MILLGNNIYLNVMSNILNSKQQEFIDIIDELAIKDHFVGVKPELLKRIGELHPNNSMHQDHDKHCNFDRSGGGHGSVCWSSDDDVDLISEVPPSPFDE
jgi:hypothetical protein